MPIINRKLYERAAEKLGISVDVVEEVYQSYWKCIKEHIEAIPLKDDISQEEFEKYPHAFRITGLGAIFCTYEKYRKKKDLVNKRRAKRNEEHKSD